MKKIFILIVLFAAPLTFASLRAQEWKKLLQQPGVKYADVMNKFYEERKQKFLERKKELANGEQREEEQDIDMQDWAGLMMLGDRLNPDGTIPNVAEKNWDALMQSTAPTLGAQQMNNMNSAAGTWVNLGPNHLNDAGFNVKGIGRVNCTFRNNLYEYAGSAGGGLWYRALNTTNWFCLTNSLPVLSISGVTTDATGNTIYVLTGDGDGAFGSGITSSGVGILKSIDGGNSWQTTSFKFNQNNFLYGYKLLSDPSDFNIQYAATTSGLYRTVDGWNSFSKILTPNGDPRVFDIEINVAFFATIYACNNGKLYKSTDRGNSWSDSVVISPSPGFNDRICLAVTPANFNYLYVLWGNGGGFQQLLRTVDGNVQHLSVRSQQGMNGVTNILGADSGGNDTRSQSWYDLCLAANPSDPDEIWMGGINIWKSANGGISWSCEGYWSADNLTIAKIHADHHSLDFFGNTLLVGCDGGFYIKSSTGWTENFEYLDITQFYKVGLDRTSNNNRHLAGAQDNSAMIYDGDDNFEQIQGAGDVGECVVDFTDNGQKLFCSDEGIKTAGAALEKIPFMDGSGIPGPDRTMWTSSGFYAWMGYRALVMDPANHNRIMSGYFGLYRSEDHNGTWASDWNGLSNDGSQGIVRHYCFTWNYNDWVSEETKLYRRTDLGAAWIDVTGGSGFPSLNNKKITGLDVNYSNNNQAWITVSGYDAANKVFSTGTNGVSWNNNTYNLPNVPVNCILRDPNTGHIYVGTDIGVYVMPYTTNTWIPFRNGMPAVPVTDMEINPTDGMLYASTFGRGLWRTDLYGGCVPTITLNSLYYPYNGEDPLGYRLYQASQEIDSYQQVWHGTGQTVLYRAGGLIRLLPLNNTQGFYVKEGSVFSASIGNCGTPPPILSQPSIINKIILTPTPSKDDIKKKIPLKL